MTMIILDDDVAPGTTNLKQLDTMQMQELTHNVMKEWARRWKEGVDPLARAHIIDFVRMELAEIESDTYKAEHYSNHTLDGYEPVGQYEEDESGRKSRKRKKREPAIVLELPPDDE